MWLVEALIPHLSNIHGFDEWPLAWGIIRVAISSAFSLQRTLDDRNFLLPNFLELRIWKTISEENDTGRRFLGRFHKCCQCILEHLSKLNSLPFQLQQPHTVSIDPKSRIISWPGSWMPEIAAYVVAVLLVDHTRLAMDGWFRTPGPGCEASAPANVRSNACS